MALRSGFFNSVSGDRKYDASFFAEYFATFIGNGVFPNPSNNFQVTAGTGMNLTIRAGKAWINGYYAIDESAFNVRLDVADGVLPRIDRVVLRLSYYDRTITIAVKKGTPASSPVASTLQRDANQYELALADIYVTNGAVSITQSNITDQRLNTALCGIVHGLVNQVDTSDIFNQYQVWFNETKAGATTELNTFLEDSELELNTSLTNSELELNTFLANKEDEFNDWFSSIQGILQGDVAGNLANQIQALSNDFTTHKNDYTKHPALVSATNVGNVYTVNLSPAPASYVNGMGLIVTINANSTGATTIKVNDLSAVPIVKANGLPVSNLRANGVYTLRYSNGNFIIQGEGGEYGTALASHVLAGRTIGTENGLVTGTIPSKSAVTITPGRTTQTISAGQYLSGTQTILGDADLMQENIKNGVNIFGVIGNVTASSLGGASMYSTGNITFNGNPTTVNCGFRPDFFILKQTMRDGLPVQNPGVGVAIGNMYWHTADYFSGLNNYRLDRITVTLTSTSIIGIKGMWYNGALSDYVWYAFKL